MTEFRHKIGDELYDLNTFDGAYETVAYPIVKRTERYVYVSPGWDRGRLIRYAVADLERTGQAWNAAHHMGVNVRPLPHWPLMPAVVTKPEQRAIGS